MAAIQQLERLHRIQEGFAGDESLESTVMKAILFTYPSIDKSPPIIAYNNISIRI